jgi:CheY-like chemotaxis protein
LIILVDDEPDIVNVFGRVLQRGGYQVSGFTDPLKALDFFAANSGKCSLIITDLRMPVMNGIEFASQVRKLSPDVKLILISAFEMDAYNDRITSLGFSGIIRKPLLPMNLKMTVQKILGGPTQ